MKSIIITGAAGFLGRYIARYFAQQSWEIIGVDNSAPENAPLSNLKAYYQMQLPNSEFHQLLQKYQPYALIHCAGRASVSLSVSEPLVDYYANTVLTLEILNALRCHAPKCRFIFLSSAAVYGNPESLPVSESQSPNPISPYGFHKWQGEQLCTEFTKVYNVPTASVRIFSAYGAGLRRQVMWDICQKVVTQNSLTLQGTGRESRDFIHTVDIARAIDVIIDHASMQGEVYNVGSGQRTTISDLANLILEVLDSHLIPNFDGIIPTGVPLYWQADISKLGQLGFEPLVSLLEGIKMFATWSKAELIGY